MDIWTVGVDERERRRPVQVLQLCQDLVDRLVGVPAVDLQTPPGELGPQRRLKLRGMFELEEP